MRKRGAEGVRRIVPDFAGVRSCVACLARRMSFGSCVLVARGSFLKVLIRPLHVIVGEKFSAAGVWLPRSYKLGAIGYLGY